MYLTRIVLGVVVFSACSLAGRAQGVCPPSTAGSLACARALLQSQNSKAAEDVARQFVGAHPGSAEGMYLLGRILQVRNEAAESLQWFTQAAAIRQPTGEDLRIVAVDYAQLNAYPEAVRWLMKSVQMDPGNAEAWYSLGRSRMMLGEMHDARAPLERSLALHPKQAKVMNNLGVVDEAENQPAAAEAAYRQAIEWQQGGARPSEQPYLNLGTLLTTQQKTAEAVPLLNQAVKLAPNDVKCNEALAKAEEQQSAFTEAIEHLSHAVALDPKSAHLHYELGQLYKHAGQPEKAKEELALSGRLYGAHSSDAEQ